MSTVTSHSVGCGVPDGFDLEKYRLMGKYRMRLTDSGARIPAELSVALTDADRARLVADGPEVYKVLLAFMEKGDNVPTFRVPIPAKPFAQYETEADGQITFEDMGKSYAEFRVDWSARTCRHKRESLSGFKFETSRIRHASDSASRYDVYWGHDTELTSDEQFFVPVSLYLIDWDNRLIYAAMSNMDTASEQAKDILAMIAALGDYETVLTWHQAKSAYAEGMRASFNMPEDFDPFS